MAEFTLELMRKKVATGLKRGIRGKSGYVGECEGWEVLGWGREGDGVDGEGRAEEEEETVVRGDESAGEGCGKANASPPPYAMVWYHGSHIPVYNLPNLLGRDHWAGLRKKFPKTLGQEIALVKRKNLTVQLQMDLWKLMGYLAER